MNYGIFDNGYDNVKVENLDGFYQKGDKVSLKQTNLPNDCIIAVKYFLDEKEEKDKYIFLLIINEKYVNYFTTLEKIKGDFPVYVNKGVSENKNQFGWEEIKLI